MNYRQPALVKFLMLGLFFYSALAIAIPSRLTDIHIITTTPKIYIDLVLSHPIYYNIRLLNHPDQLIVDLDNVQVDFNLKQITTQSPRITTFRNEKRTLHNQRLSFGLPPGIKLASIVHYSSNQGEQISIELSLPTPIETIKGLSPKTLSHPPRAAEVDNKKAAVEPPIVKTIAMVARPLTTQRELPPVRARNVVVILDPGHGGKDPGTTGPGGIHEKDIVLAIAKVLQTQLQKQSGIKVLLTRTADYFIPLRERLSIARKAKGDIFVAIHADAFTNPYSEGASVFALSESGASSEAARWLAEKENYSELGSVNLGHLDDKDAQLRSVLINLSQNYTIVTSLQLGSDVLNQLRTLCPLHTGRIEQARFAVLKSPDIPSILVETGFLSNPNEEARLKDPDYQQKIALALKNGIYNYFLNNPPPETQLALQQAKIGKTY